MPKKGLRESLRDLGGRPAFKAQAAAKVRVSRLVSHLFISSNRQLEAFQACITYPFRLGAAHSILAQTAFIFF